MSFEVWLGQVSSQKSNKDVCAFLQAWPSFCREWFEPPCVAKASLSNVTGLPNQWVTCIFSESSAVTGKRLKADLKLEHTKKNLKQGSLSVVFMSKEDFLGLILNRINLHSQGEYYVHDLSLMTGSYNVKLSQLQIFSGYCGKQVAGPDIIFIPL